MNTLICVSPGNLEYGNIDEPQPSEGRAIVKIRRIGICGTDLHAYSGNQPYFTYPRILGHELSGELAENSSANGFKAGDPVSIIPYFNCGTCVACRAGKTNCCAQLKVCGVHIDGGMVEYLSVPATHLMPANGLSLDQLALVEPLAIGAHGVRRADVRPGEFVLVIGAGPIGLGAMEFARLAGARVIALDVSEARLQFCARHMQVYAGVNGRSTDVLQQLRDITEGDMPTVVMDATGNLQAIKNAFQYMAHSGRYVIVGIQLGDISFSHPEFHKREGTLLSSRNATKDDFARVMNAIASSAVDTSKYITHRVKFGQVRDEFSKWLKPEAGVIKAMVEM